MARAMSEDEGKGNGVESKKFELHVAAADM